MKFNKENMCQNNIIKNEIIFNVHFVLDIMKEIKYYELKFK